MARREALLRLHKHLTGRRNSLRRTLAGELADLRSSFRGDMTGDAADAAFDAGSDEVSSQLAQLEARELNLIDRAIARIKNGTFGVCEGCGCKIPVARLNALPYSSTCIECQQDAEQHGGWGDGTSGDWGKVYDAESSYEDRHVNLADLEVETAAAR